MINKKGNIMALRIIFLLLAFGALINLIIIALGFIFNVNPYKKYTKEILFGFGILILIFVLIYVILPVLGLV